jgi:uncharacterized protein HemY
MEQKNVIICHIRNPFDENIVNMLPSIPIENEEKIIEEIREALSNYKYSGGKIEIIIK